MNVLTRSPLCLRDVDLFRRFDDLEVGLSITTDREEVRRLLEPRAPPIRSRIEALRALHAAGVRTYAFAGPLLPMDPERLAEALGEVEKPGITSCWKKSSVPIARRTPRRTAR